jgi:hypothetical protein
MGQEEALPAEMLEEDPSGQERTSQLQEPSLLRKQSPVDPLMLPSAQTKCTVGGNIPQSLTAQDVD